MTRGELTHVILRKMGLPEKIQEPIEAFGKSRGGLPQDPEATLPALYIAGHDLKLNPQTTGGSTGPSAALPTTVHLTMRCG